MGTSVCSKYSILVDIVSICPASTWVILGKAQRVKILMCWDNRKEFIVIFVGRGWKFRLYDLSRNWNRMIFLEMQLPSHWCCDVGRKIVPVVGLICLASNDNTSRRFGRIVRRIWTRLLQKEENVSRLRLDKEIYQLPVEMPRHCKHRCGLFGTAPRNPMNIANTSAAGLWFLTAKDLMVRDPKVVDAILFSLVYSCCCPCRCGSIDAVPMRYMRNLELPSSRYTRYTGVTGTLLPYLNLRHTNLQY